MYLYIKLNNQILKYKYIEIENKKISDGSDFREEQKMVKKYITIYGSNHKNDSSSIASARDICMRSRRTPADPDTNR